MIKKHSAFFFTRGLIITVFLFVITAVFLVFVPPSSIFVILVFLTLLYFFIVNFIASVVFYAKFKNEERVWYLKEDEYKRYILIGVFVALFVCLGLLLSYFTLLNFYTFFVLVVLTLGGYILQIKNS